MEELYQKGLVKAIGVSNHNVHHLMNILENCEIKPMVNQVETHIELQNHFLQEYCEANSVLLEAYAPLMSWKIQDMLDNEVMQGIAKKHGKTVPQVAIRWFVERGVIVIPKSVTPSRIEANYEVWDFSLDKKDMQAIRTLNKGNKLFPEFDNVDY
jgi:diketogulonate reductase-like aldo/keto reductase